ncbi:MAG: hypothetical protein ACRD6U_06855 [Nitrososphaeraceae archaeon]
MTRADEFYTRFVYAFDQLVDKNKIDWAKELKRWIAEAKKNESISIFVSGFYCILLDLKTMISLYKRKNIFNNNPKKQILLLKY